MAVFKEPPHNRRLSLSRVNSAV